MTEGCELVSVSMPRSRCARSSCESCSSQVGKDELDTVVGRQRGHPLELDKADSHLEPAR